MSQELYRKSSHGNSTSMRGLKIDLYSYLTILVFIGFSVWTNYVVHGSCPKTEKKLWAYKTPVTEYFTDSYKNKFLSSDRIMVCRWIIATTDDDSSIKLTFPSFHLKNSTQADKGDCLEIHYGEDLQKLDVLCDDIPKESYSSTDGEIMVVYKRGEVDGERQFSMTYSSQSVLNKEKIIQIAGIVGAILAGLGLGYVVLKVTKCCKCLRRKDSSDSNHSGSTRERDRLVLNVAPGGAANIQNNSANESSSQPSNNHSALSPAIPDAGTTDGATSNGNGHDSDTESLQDMNEPPPSYESLYLNELGESVTPPKYSPPVHRSTHPPRRVNTFN